MNLELPEITSEIVKREYDNKWVVVGYVPDPNFHWSQYSEKRNVTYTPYRWLTLGVFDEKTTAEKQRLSLYNNFKKLKEQHRPILKKNR